jgi:DNA-binding transcriptional LysR family regulator
MSTTPTHFDLDGRALALLVAVHDEGSVTGASARLGLSQSAVSHALDRLRTLVGDELFVKSGRGIAPTARANDLVQQARHLLDQMRHFTMPQAVDPARLQVTWTVAANDHQAQLLLPEWLRRIQLLAPGFRLRVMPSTVPTLGMLRDEQCQLVISPRPPESDDVVQKRLFVDHYRVFYDANCREAPLDMATYQAAEHVSVQYLPSQRTLDIDGWLQEQGIHRNFAVTVPGFAGVRPFLQGSTRLATLPSLLLQTTMQGLATAPPPVEPPTMPMYAIWHLRHQNDPVHRWLRVILEQVVADRLG